MRLSSASRFADVGGIRTHYLDVGDGPPLVLLHSGEFGSNAEITWELNIPSLAEHFRVIAPDWLGYGRTDKIRDFVGGADRMMRHLAAFLRTIAIDEADFAGVSVGGTLLLQEAAKPDCRLPISRMAVVSGGGFMPDNEARRSMLDYDGTAEGMKRILRATLHDERWINDEAYVARRVALSLEPGAWEAIASSRFKAPNIPPRSEFGREDTTPYERVPFPTLVIAGGADRLREPGYEHVLRRIPDVEIHVVADAGHMVTVDKPEVVNELLIAFFGSVASAPETSAVEAPAA